MATIKRLINEEGIVLSKNYSEARDPWTKSDGTEVAAQPEKYEVLVASGEKVSNDTGFQNCVVQTYKVSREEFQALKYLQKVMVSYEFSTYGPKPISVAPLKIGG
mgnify:CR=1 FL=1